MIMVIPERRVVTKQMAKVGICCKHVQRLRVRKKSDTFEA